MAIVRWNPWALSQLMNDTDLLDMRWEETAPVNVSEDGEMVHVDMQLPGIPRENIKITVEGNTLTVRADVHQEEEHKDRKYYRKEIQRQSIVRSITLPTHVASDKAEAEFENGMLRLSIPKAEEAKPKEISLTK